MEAKREILKRFQTQSSSSVDIPKEYHGFILGKGGVKLKELEKQTATKIIIPKESETGRIVVTGPKEGEVSHFNLNNISLFLLIAFSHLQALKKPCMRYK